MYVSRSFMQHIVRYFAWLMTCGRSLEQLMLDRPFFAFLGAEWRLRQWLYEQRGGMLSNRESWLDWWTVVMDMMWCLSRAEKRCWEIFQWLLLKSYSELQPQKPKDRKRISSPDYARVHTDMHASHVPVGHPARYNLYEYKHGPSLLVL
jgi:hypothetical protein